MFDPVAAKIATGNIINAGGIASTLYAADPFVMEYTDGLPLSEVAWGRELTPLSLSQPPATMQLAIPGLPHVAGDLDVKFSEFSRLLESAIDFSDVQSPQQETPPGALTGVPLN